MRPMTWRMTGRHDLLHPGHAQFPPTAAARACLGILRGNQEIGVEAAVGQLDDDLRQVAAVLRGILGPLERGKHRKRLLAQPPRSDGSEGTAVPAAPRVSAPLGDWPGLPGSSHFHDDTALPPQGSVREVAPVSSAAVGLDDGSASSASSSTSTSTSHACPGAARSASAKTPVLQQPARAPGSDLSRRRFSIVTLVAGTASSWP